MQSLMAMVARHTMVGDETRMKTMIIGGAGALQYSILFELYKFIPFKTFS